MNKNIEGCGAIYCHKMFLDSNYNQKKSLKCLKFN